MISPAPSTRHMTARGERRVAYLPSAYVLMDMPYARLRGERTWERICAMYPRIDQI